MQPLSTLPLIWLSSLPSLSVYPHTPSVPFCLGLWTESKPCLGAKIGRTALHRAVELLDTEIRGDISARFEHWTRESKDAQEMIRLLLDHGADRGAKDAKGNTPEQLALDSRCNHWSKGQPNAMMRAMPGNQSQQHLSHFEQLQQPIMEMLISHPF